MVTTKKKLNLQEKRERRRVALVGFLQDYGRKAQKGIEPNDRKYSEGFAEWVRRHVKPTDMDALLRDDD